MQYGNWEEIDSRSECRVCLGLHDEGIHDATVNIHLWLRSEIARRTQAEEYAVDDLDVVISSSIPGESPAMAMSQR